MKLDGEEEIALLIDLGQALERVDPSTLSHRPTSSENFVQRAKTWLESELTRLQTIVCNSKRVRAAATDPTTNTSKLVQITADAICAFYTLLPCVTIAKLLLSEGITKICESQWLE